MPTKAASASSMPLREMAGAGIVGSGEQFPTLPGLSQDWPGGQEGSAQHVSSTQLPDMQSVGASQLPPSGRPVLVGVAVGVLVGVSVTVAVGVTVGVSVEVAVGVCVGVLVGVSVGVSVGV